MRAGLVVAFLLAVAGCRTGRVEPEVAPPLPPIPVYEISSRVDTVGATISRVESRDPLAQVTSTRRVTLSANNAEARTLLLWLAQQAEASIVISPDVQARVSVSFRDVPVVDAMRAIIAEAGLSVLLGPMKAPWPPVVFYQLPVNINTADAETIAARFGVSLELAKFIVESRVVRPQN
jgi:hypothetical protein